jgi:hypothetical protein
MENDGTKRDLENGFTPVFGAARVREFMSFCGAAAYRSAAKAAGGRPPSNVRPGTRSYGPAGRHTLVTKATKEFTDASGRRKVKGNMDIELAVDAMELAAQVDQIVLFWGDGDFRSLVEAVQRPGVRVTVVSTASTQPATRRSAARSEARFGVRPFDGCPD